MGEKLIPKSGLRIGVNEVSHVQNGAHERLTDFFLSVMNTSGVALRASASGTLSDDLEVRDGGGYNIYISAGRAIDSSGNLINIPENTELIDVSTEMATTDAYLVLLTYSTTMQGPGSVCIKRVPANPAGQRNVITGTDTEFTEDFRVGMYIEISGSSSFDHVWIITNVISDTELRVSDYYVGAGSPTAFPVSGSEECELIYYAIGDYASGYPLTGNSRVYLHDYYQIEVRLESSGYTVGSELVLGRLQRVGTTMIITDLRSWNILSLRSGGWAELGEYLAPMAPALVRVSTGATMMPDIEISGLFSPSVMRHGTHTIDAYLLIEWGWEAEASTSSRSFISGKWRMTDSAASGWTTDYWKLNNHYLIDSENNLHVIVSSGSNYVEIETMPTVGKFWITPNGEAYEVVITPINESGSMVHDAISHYEVHASSPVKMKYHAFAGVIPGQRYKVEVCTFKNNMRSNYVRANPLVIIAGETNIPSLVPTISLNSLMAAGIRLTITNHADALAAEYPTVAYEIYTKFTNTATDYPDISETYLKGIIEGSEMLFPIGLHETHQYLTVRVRAIGQTGMVTDSVLGAVALPEGIDSGDIILGGGEVYTINWDDAVRDLMGFLSGIQTGLLRSIVDSRARDIVLQQQDVNVCCNTSTTSSTTTIATFTRQDWLNAHREGMVNGEFYRQDWGRRYALEVTKFRISLAAPVVVDTNITLQTASGSYTVTMTAGASSLSSFVNVSKESVDTLTITTDNPISSPVFGIKFRITGFGIFEEAGSTEELYYEGFPYEGMFSDGQNLEPAGIDYDVPVNLVRAYITADNAPTADAVIRISDEPDGAGEYMDVTIGTSGTGTQTGLVRIASSEFIYFKIITANGIGDINIHLDLEGSGTVSCIYPYASAPFFEDHHFVGLAMPGTHTFRTYDFNSETHWFWCELASPAPSPITIKLKAAGIVGDGITLYFNTGDQIKSSAGTIALLANQALQIEYTGNPLSFNIVWEFIKSST